MAGLVNRSNGVRYGGRPQLIELAGPAGAGKSTLSTELAGRLNGAPESIWGLPVLPLLTDGLHLIPTFSGLWLPSRSLLWAETRHMVRLQTLSRTLESNPAPPSDVMIFDEGPIFAMAWLRGFGHQVMREPPSALWWRSAVRQWASLIDTVVVLDAPDQLLAQRIRARPHDHEVKEFPDHEIARWMARFRDALDWVLNELTLQGGPVVVRLSSGEQPSKRLADQLVHELSGSARAR